MNPGSAYTTLNVICLNYTNLNAGGKGQDPDHLCGGRDNWRTDHIQVKCQRYVPKRCEASVSIGTSFTQKSGAMHSYCWVLYIGCSEFEVGVRTC